MTRNIFNDLPMLWLLWGVPLLCLFFYYASVKRRNTLARFVDHEMLGPLNASTSLLARRWKVALLLSAFIFMVIGAARPTWTLESKKIARQGRDVIFLLDVSNSMLATDLAPNRLERSKLAILDCLDQLAGDRIALVVFAGDSIVKCPLTLDYGFFRLMLENISVYSVNKGGTLIGNAVREALDKVFDKRKVEYRDIILISDGEDHESLPVEAAVEAGKRGIRIIAIGLGDENHGRRIPIENESGQYTYIKDKYGEDVYTKLDAKILRRMAIATPGGRYLNVGTGNVDLGRVYNELIRTASQAKLEDETIERYHERFQIFLIIALIILIFEMFIRERKLKARTL